LLQRQPNHFAKLFNATQIQKIKILRILSQATSNGFNIIAFPLLLSEGYMSKV
jgi:hypothetical protein